MNDSSIHHAEGKIPSTVKIIYNTVTYHTETSVRRTIVTQEREVTGARFDHCV